MTEKKTESFLITREQAIGFAEAVAGWTSFSEEAGMPNSPHLRTHLQAVLGSRGVPSEYEVRQAFEAEWRKKDKREWSNDEEVVRKVRRFAQYLREMSEVLAGRADCGEGS